MKHNLWKHRATAILGLVVLLLPLTGLPVGFKGFIYVVAGFLITLFTVVAIRTDRELAEELGPTPLPTSPTDQNQV